MRRHILHVIWLGMVLGFSLGSTPVHAFGKHKTVAADPVIAPIVAGDPTAIVQGCGAQPIVGFTYCRIVEGDAADQNIDFIGPPAKCNNPDGTTGTACAFVKVYNQSGQLAWGGSIPKGQTRVSVPWTTLLGAPQFQQANRGFWSWLLEVHWTDPDHHDRVTVTQGEIRLAVYKSGYIPLDTVSSDPNYVWTWIDGNSTYHMTSNLRAYVETKK